ncbi:MAG: hypothetical protein AB7I41_12145 [Candidatus Sericytochromatia bacterium]
MKQTKDGPGLTQLLGKFVPLSLSDIIMAMGDPLQTMALSRLPQAPATLASLGVVKSIAVFLESPIIMILHASTALGKQTSSRKALWRFSLLLSSLLSLVFTGLCIGPVYNWLLYSVFGVNTQVAEIGRTAFLMMIAWPFVIAWRRYFQGLLIRSGDNKYIGYSSFLRLGWVIGILLIGVSLRWNGAVLGGLALIGGVFWEALVVTWFALRLNVVSKIEALNLPKDSTLPDDLKNVAKYYMPLATTMILVWGGRALLSVMVARSLDSTVALAAWPAAWGLVLAIANATRMVQQIVISHAEQVKLSLIVRFSFIVGFCCSLVLAFLGWTPWGETVLQLYLGQNHELLEAVHPVIFYAVLFPLFLAFQNALQGLLINYQQNWLINLATLMGVLLMLSLCWFFVSTGQPGALSAAWAMHLGALVEIFLLCGSLAWVLRLHRVGHEI